MPFNYRSMHRKNLKKRSAAASTSDDGLRSQGVEAGSCETAAMPSSTWLFVISLVGKICISHCRWTKGEMPRICLANTFACVQSAGFGCKPFSNLDLLPQALQLCIPRGKFGSRL